VVWTSIQVRWRPWTWFIQLSNQAGVNRYLCLYFEAVLATLAPDFVDQKILLLYTEYIEPCLDSYIILSLLVCFLVSILVPYSLFLTPRSLLNSKSDTSLFCSNNLLSYLEQIRKHSHHTVPYSVCLHSTSICPLSDLDHDTVLFNGFFLAALGYWLFLTQ
jgi:hypothetical protein